MQLPIDIVPGLSRRFKWKQTFTTPVGTRTVEHTGTLPLNVEDSVAALITMCKHLVDENAELRATIEGIDKAAQIENAAPWGSKLDKPNKRAK